MHTNIPIIMCNNIWLNVLAFICFLNSYAQTTIEGTILFQNTPVQDAHVYIAGTSLGSATNAEGNYRIKEVPKGKIVLVISSLGYKKQRKAITITDETTINQNFK